jgi:hypothetical protein
MVDILNIIRENIDPETKEPVVDEQGNPIPFKNYQLSFELGTLVVSEISNEKDANGQDILTPIMIQPWKCLPDGSRDNFADSQDAFDWFESVKDRII